MTEKKHHTFRIIDTGQSRRVSIFRFPVALAVTFAVTFGPGVIADSAAMQWAGFVVLMLISILFVLGFAAQVVTIDEARAKLDELEAESKGKRQ